MTARPSRCASIPARDTACSNRPVGRHSGPTPSPGSCSGACALPGADATGLAGDDASHARPEINRRVHAMWQPDGRSLTYLNGLDVMRVAFAEGAVPDLGRPTRLFRLQADDRLLDVMKDGRFVVMRRAVA